ncbi:MAG: Ig domain-containing protein [Lachnospiraceae bacterium]|nr:Ig domain-containing protein [Lachnospiraceae bacterium]
MKKKIKKILCMVLAFIMTASTDLALLPSQPVLAAGGGGAAAPLLTEASYEPVTARLTATFATTELDAEYYESYLLTKKDLGEYAFGTKELNGETYNIWGIMSFDSSDEKHVTIDRSSGQVTLSQPMYFQDRRYDMYPKPDETVYAAVETPSGGWSSPWELTVPSAGSPGTVKATLASIEPVTVPVEGGGERTATIATLSVTFEREEGEKAYFAAALDPTKEYKLGTGIHHTQPGIRINESGDPYWEINGETPYDPNANIGPDGEKITIAKDDEGNDVSLTAEVKVCESDNPYEGYQDGGSIFIWAKKLSGDMMVSCTDAYIEIPMSASNIGKTYVYTDDPVPTINTSSLPDASTLSNYTATLEGTAMQGGDLSWSLESGSSLPAGLTLSTAGVISGRPTQEGEYSFTIKLTEAGLEKAATKKFKLKVKGDKPVINVDTPLPAARKGVPYSIKLKGTDSRGGSLAWSMKAGAGALPEGLSLDAEAAEITGTPANSIAAGTEYSFTVVLTETKDGSSKTAEKELSLTVNDPYHYTAQYLLNGGSKAGGGEIPDIDASEADEVSLAEAPVRLGYQFNGWRIDNKVYEAGARLRIPVSKDNDKKFVSAQWDLLPPTSVTYDGEFVNTVYLEGSYEEGGQQYSVLLGSDYYSKPGEHFQKTVSAREMTAIQGKDKAALELWTYVNGNRTMIARHEGVSENQITLEKVNDSIKLVKGVKAEGLQEGVDFILSRLYSVSDQWSYIVPPCLIDTNEAKKAVIQGRPSSPNYMKYDWSKDYAADVLDGDGYYHIAPSEVEEGITVGGTVTYQGAPMTGIEVLFTQNKYGQYLNRSAITDGDGKYRISGLYADSLTTFRVISGGQKVCDGEIPAGSMTADKEDLDLTVTTGSVLMNVSIDTAGLEGFSESERQRVARRVGENEAFITFKKKGTENVVARSNLYPYQGDIFFSVPVKDETEFDWTITGSVIREASGTVNLEKGADSKEISLKPAAGAATTLSAAIYSTYALAWFDGDGSYLGASRDLALAGSEDTYYSACPGGAGSYTLALMPQNVSGILHRKVSPSDPESSRLEDFGDDSILKRWDFTLADGEVKKLEGCNIDQDTSNASRYATRPNSSMSADRKSFVSTSELVKFSGTIGLDSGLKNGSLTRFEIYPTNKQDGVSWSNSANVQAIVLGGRKFDADDLSMSGTGYYYLDPYPPVSLPCEYSIYCKPGNDSWDMQLSAYADVNYRNGNVSYQRSSQLIGSAIVTKPGSFIATLSSYVCTDQVYVKGQALPDREVYVYDNDRMIGTAKADYRGSWSTMVTLSGIDPDYMTTHVLTCQPEGGDRSEGLYVFHDAKGPQLTQFKMGWKEYSRNYEINVGDSYVFHGQMSDVTFTAQFTHPESLTETIYTGETEEESRNAKVVFKYYLTNGDMKYAYATEGEGGVFTATLPRTLYSSVTSAEVLYEPKPDWKPYDIEGVTTVLSQTEMDNLKDSLGNMDETVSQLFSEDNKVTVEEDGTISENFVITFNEDGTVKDLPGSFGEGEAEEAKAALQQYVQYKKDAFGVVPESYAVEYNAGDTFAWMNQAGEDWLASDKEGEESQIVPYAMYSRNFTLADQADYDKELAQLKAHAGYQYSLKNGESEIGNEFIFTDAEINGTEIEGGSFLAVVTAFHDAEQGIYEIDAELMVMYGFQSFGDQVPALEASGEIRIQNAPEAVGIKSQSTTTKTLGKAVDNTGNVVDIGSFGVKVVQQTNAVNAVFKSAGTAATAGKVLKTAGKVLEKAGTGLGVLSLALDTYNYVNYRQESPENAKKMHDSVNIITQSPEWKMIQDAINRPNAMYTCRTSNLFIDKNTPTRENFLGNDGSWGIPSIRDRMLMMQMCESYWRSDDLSYSTAATVGLSIKGGATATAIGGAFIPGAGWIVSGAATGVGIVGGGICDHIAGDKEAVRLENYKMFIENAQYLFNWYEANYGFPKKDEASQEEQGGGGETPAPPAPEEEKPSLEKAMELMDDNSITTQPPVTNKVSNDPAGIVFEGVIENPVENAKVTLFYAADDMGERQDKDHAGDVTRLIRAEGIEELIPAVSTQTTGADGKYSWGVPEGLWYVTAEHGGLVGTSEEDQEAKVTSSGSLSIVSPQVTGIRKLLPVLPVQLDVNIPLTDTTAPQVTDVEYTEGEGVYVTFSKYMKEGTGGTSCLDVSNYTLKIDGEAKWISGISANECGHVPANLNGEDGTTTYTKTVLLEYDLKAGDNVELKVKNTIQSYAGTAIGGEKDYECGGTVEAKQQVPVPVMKLGSRVISNGESVRISKGDGLTLEPGEGSPASAKLYYSTVSGNEGWTEYKTPIVITDTVTIQAKAQARGYNASNTVSANFIYGNIAAYTVSGNVTTYDGGSADGIKVSLASGDYSRDSVVKEGTFRFDEVLPGSYSLSFQGNDKYAAQEVPVEVKDSDVAIAIRLEKAGSGDEPVPGPGDRSYRILVSDGVSAKNSAGNEVRSARPSEVIQIAWTAKEGYELAAWDITGAMPAAVSANATTFVMGTQDVYVGYAERLVKQNEVIETKDYNLPPAEKDIKVSKLTFSKKTLKMQRNDAPMSNPAVPAMKAGGTAPAVHYTTGNKDIVAVDQSGNLYPMGQGQTMIKAYCGNKTASCKVTVSSYTRGVSILNDKAEEVNDGTITILGGQSIFLTASIDPYDTTDSRKTAWTSDNKKVTVKNGIVTAKEVNAEVTAKITAKATATNPQNGKKVKISSTVTVKVIPAVPEKASSKDKSHTLTLPAKKAMVSTEGKNTAKIAITIKSKKDIKEGQFQIVSCNSTNPKVLEVGTVSGASIQGKKMTAEVTVTAKGPGTAYLVIKSIEAGSTGSPNVKRCKVTVKVPAVGIQAQSGTLKIVKNGNDKTITMRKGAKGTVEALLDPAYSTDVGKVQFAGSGGISCQNGLVTAKAVTKSGKPAKLIVKCGKMKETVYVTVTE